MEAQPLSRWLDEVVFLGTGTSSQVPAIHCITGARSACGTCADAVLSGSRNRRRCTSVVAVGSRAGERAQRMSILIDCGKSFYESAIAHFPAHGLRRIDAVLLTHAHADAILGLDDLRSWTIGACVQTHVDVYLTAECMATVRSTFPYLVDRAFVTGGGDVGALRWHLIDAQTPFTAAGVEVVPLPVEHGFTGAHGAPFECLGFRIDSMSYHNIPDATLTRMVGSELLVLDGLKMSPHTSHFSLPQAVECALALAQRDSACGATVSAPLVLFTDITHQMEHTATEDALQNLLRGLRTWRHAHPDVRQPDWWADIWDARSNEMHLRFSLRSNVPQPTHPIPYDPLVPPMHLAWDGLRVPERLLQAIMTRVWAALLASVCLVLAADVLYRRSRKAHSTTLSPRQERIVIVGASTIDGIGVAIARQCLARGSYNIMLVAQRADALRHVKEQLVNEQTTQAGRELASQMHLAVADCTSETSVLGLEMLVSRDFGGIDTLYIVPGTMCIQSMLAVAGMDPVNGSTSAEPTEQGMAAVASVVQQSNDLNLKATALLLTALVPRLQTNSTRPYVAVIGSLASLIPAPTRALYCATKSAQQQLVLSMAIECETQAKYPGRALVRFVVLAPSTVRTSFGKNLGITGVDDRGANYASDSSAMSSDDVAATAVESVERGLTGVVPVPSKFWYAWLLYPLLPRILARGAHRRYKY
ncbi:hypothetical protein MSPP1_002394 [Malassezia sp. CBS 17886]|nr:hypothetical protein MSPP1_002394 [Malassezia sp. CBS 17886]